jgi:hypothetical protein
MVPLKSTLAPNWSAMDLSLVVPARPDFLEALQRSASEKLFREAHWLTCTLPDLVEKNR